MQDHRLTIPLNQPHPARQRFWRAVWLVTLVIFGLIIGLIAYRWITLHNPLLAWPAEATMALRLPKTPENVDDVSHLFPGAILAGNLPLNVSQELRHSRGEITLFFSESGQVIGLATDRILTSEEQTAISLMGLKLAKSKSSTTIGLSSAVNNRRLATPWLIWPQFDGSLSLLKDDKITSTPLVITSEFMVLRGDFSTFESNPNLSLDTQTTLLAAFSAPADLANNLLPDVPAVFPGIKTLASAMQNPGFSLILGKDQTGTAYAISLENQELTTEELGQITKELVQVSNLSRQDWTFDFKSFDELRGQEVEVDLAHDVDLNRIVATSPNGDLARATQTTQATIISNRQTSLNQNQLPADPCLSKADGFVAPLGLSSLLAPANIYQAHDLTFFLQKSQRLSWSESRLKVCF